MNLADIRTDYRRGRLSRADLRPSPFEQFDLWMEEALREGVLEPTAMSLATVGCDGAPLLRTVLLKGVSPEGFVFFTNLTSRKAAQIGENAQAALLFPWLALQRQVIVRGPVVPVSREEVRRYFSSRPHESQLAAWASRQSQPIASRAELEARLVEVKARFGEGEVPLPDFWGGYRVEPATIEFWQGGANRLHDRFQYRRSPAGPTAVTGDWFIERLSP